MFERCGLFRITEILVIFVIVRQDVIRQKVKKNIRQNVIRQSF
jgi:hypothetical protein